MEEEDGLKLKPIGSFLEMPALNFLGWGNEEAMRELIDYSILTGKIDEDGNYLTTKFHVKALIFIQELSSALNASYLRCLLEGKEFDFDEEAIKYLTLRRLGQNLTRNNISKLIPLEEE